ncbi:MAG: 50S ribosomal protein L30 [Flavobacteriales bacterium]|nr:MAG: 50S ribosomal protein L30 [Flavobacteriales bacterium]CAI8339658.1 MAG: 50S ribosomal protein L30 [Flavobacteriales bacterium]|tara:strand:- start:95 stop:280 length:186 start_codon:yes stop_codon:yes gene_type:complete
MSKKIRIKQVRSTIKRLESQKRTLKALGLRKIGMEVEHELTSSISGMIDKVRHLVEVNSVK